MYKSGPQFFLGLTLGFVTLVGATGCHRDPNFVDSASAPDNSGPDPADANMAPVDNSQPALAPASAPAAAPAPPPQGRVLAIRSEAQPQQTAESYAPQYPPQQTPFSRRRPVLPGRPDRRPARRRRPGPTRRVRRSTPTASPRLRPASSPRAQLHLDPRLLVLGSRRLLLDPRRLVRPTLLRSPLDPRLLGLVSQPLGFPPRLLGPAHRLLRRHQLRLRLHRRRLPRRLLERQ